MGRPPGDCPPTGTWLTSTIDWSAGWLAPWRSGAEPVVAAVAAGAPVWQALNQHLTAPVQFVPQARLPAGMPYEQFVAQSGNCPTRDGLHDLFNGLCWSLFPATKRRLNLLQAAQIARDGILPTRGRVRDALTVFDENAALLQAPDALWNALAQRQWQLLFTELRPLWSQARLVLFGHALLEKLATPRKSITAHVLRVDPSVGSDLASWDHWLAGALDPRMLADGPFVPLPVLGVPGWWPANENPSFYLDAQVFRAAPAPRRKGQ
jgi:hypothetical protein